MIGKSLNFKIFMNSGVSLYWTKKIYMNVNKEIAPDWSVNNWAMHLGGECLN